MKHLVDIDDADLSEAKAALGTATIKETVARALREAAAAAARRREIDRLSAGLLSEFEDPEKRRQTWQR